MRQVPHVIRNALPEPGLIVVENVEEAVSGIVVRVRARTRRPACPTCSRTKVSYHSSYRRRLRDLPWQGKTVVIEVLARRFRCRTRRCSRKIFAERLPGLAPRLARHTPRLSELTRRIGYAVGGLPGSRLLRLLAAPMSYDTVLRRVKAPGERCDGEAVRVLAVDDWAWRKQGSYGTILMDLERHRVIDLLPVRSAESFADWLQAHPGVEVITRDRCGLHAEGGHLGAPAAVQVNDRYHLVDNLVEAMEQDVRQLQVRTRSELSEGRGPRLKETPWRRGRRLRCREARYQRYLAVVEAHRQGQTQLEIARKVGMSAETVAIWIHAREFPERRIRSNRRRDLALLLQDQRDHSFSNMTYFSPARVAALLAKPRRGMGEEQQTYMDRFLHLCPSAWELRRHALRFRAMLRWANARRLSEWMTTAEESAFPFLANYARNLRRDYRAVELAIETPWSNGPVERQINRLKAIKRQMYGRAGFELLKARVMPFEPLAVA
jgi:transposase